MNQTKLLSFLREMKDHYETTITICISNTELDWLKGNINAINEIIKYIEKEDTK